MSAMFRPCTPITMTSACSSAATRRICAYGLPRQLFEMRRRRLLPRPLHNVDQGERGTRALGDRPGEIDGRARRLAKVHTAHEPRERQPRCRIGPRGHRQYRAGRLAKNLLGHRTEDESFDPTRAMGSEDEKG